jgi:hypothetical protein
MAVTAVMAARAQAAPVTYTFTGTKLDSYESGDTSFGETIFGTVTLDPTAAIDYIDDLPHYGGQGATWTDGSFGINAVTDAGYTVGTWEGGGNTTFSTYDLLSYQPPARPYYLGSTIFWKGGDGVSYKDITLSSYDINTAGDGIPELPDPWTPTTDPIRYLTINEYNLYTGEQSYASYSLDSFEVSPPDTSPPTFTSLTPSTATLWPPNHQMVPITLAAVVRDLVGVVSTTIISATSSEADEGLDDEDIANDIQITGDLTLSLRAERSGDGNGRTYTITVEATDAAGNATQKTTIVSVPKSHSK